MTFVLREEDVRTDLHPVMWRDICESLGVEPDEYGLPEEITIKAVKEKKE